MKGLGFYYCLFFVWIGCIFGTNFSDFSSIDNNIRLNPELVHELLDNYIIGVKESASLSKLVIVGELAKAIPVKKNINRSKSKNNRINHSKRSNDNIKSVVQRDKVECSAFFIGKDGYIISNYSILKDFLGVKKFYTVLNLKEKGKVVDKKVDVELVGYDEYYDVVIFKSAVKPVNYVSLGDYNDSKGFRYVYNICGDTYKLSGCTDVEFNINKSNKLNKNNKKVSNDNGKKSINCYSRSFNGLIPCILVDINGSLVGMHVNFGKFVGNKLCGFDSIIPFSYLRPVVNNIISKKYNIHKYSSFNIVSVSDRVKSIKRLSVNRGCYIESINITGSGLCVGDIILKVNGYLADTVEDFDKFFDRIKNFDLDFSVNRNGKELKVRVPGGIFSDIRYKVVKDKLEMNGAVLNNLTTTQLNHLKGKNSSCKGGVLVSNVTDNNVWKCGNNFVITKVYNKFSVYSIDDVIDVFKNINSYIGSDVHNTVPFVVEGFYMNDPVKKECFLFNI